MSGGSDDGDGGLKMVFVVYGNGNGGQMFVYERTEDRERDERKDNKMTVLRTKKNENAHKNVCQYVYNTLYTNIYIYG